ncbi:MAG: hypothetical protein ABEI74_04760 [Candidatus Pacearchaeota archaeon]
MTNEFFGFKAGPVELGIRARTRESTRKTTRKLKKGFRKPARRKKVKGGKSNNGMSKTRKTA